MVAIIGGVSLVIEAGNAYAHQRVAQNGVDSIANAGATVLAERLGGAVRTDADVDARDARDGGRERRSQGYVGLLHERHRRPARSERRTHEQPQGGRGRRRRA